MITHRENAARSHILLEPIVNHARPSRSKRKTKLPDSQTEASLPKSESESMEFYGILLTIDVMGCVLNRSQEKRMVVLDHFIVNVS